MQRQKDKDIYELKSDDFVHCESVTCLLDSESSGNEEPVSEEEVYYSIFYFLERYKNGTFLTAKRICRNILVTN